MPVAQSKEDYKKKEARNKTYVSASVFLANMLRQSEKVVELLGEGGRRADGLHEVSARQGPVMFAVHLLEERVPA